MSLLSRFQDWLYPELKSFGSREDRKRALMRCSPSFSREFWLAWIVLVGGVLIWVFIWRLVFAPRLAEYLILAGVPRLIGIVILFLSLVLVIGALWVAALWLEAPAIRRRLRKLMADEELHRCESCGYNLTGNVSGVCPECGERI